MWVPDYCGVQGNEEADELAGRRIQHKTIEELQKLVGDTSVMEYL